MLGLRRIVSSFEGWTFDEALTVKRWGLQSSVS